MPSTPLKINGSLVKMSSRSGVGYILNRDTALPLRKVEGEPSVGSGAAKSHALREAFVALQIASLPQMARVLIGDEAYEYIYPTGGPKQRNCDVVGVFEGTGALSWAKERERVSSTAFTSYRYRPKRWPDVELLWCGRHL